jgi:hypothetical protein
LIIKEMSKLNRALSKRSKRDTRTLMQIMRMKTLIIRRSLKGYKERRK